MSNENKKVVVQHKKSFANTKIGGALDGAIASAVSVGAMALVGVVASVVIAKGEEVVNDIRIRNFMKKAKVKAMGKE